MSLDTEPYVIMSVYIIVMVTSVYIYTCIYTFENQTYDWNMAHGCILLCSW